MDTLSHALWGKGLFGYRGHGWLPILFGVFPDLLSFGTLFVIRIVNGDLNYSGLPTLESLLQLEPFPKWVFALIKRYGGNAMIYKVGKNFSQIQDRLATPEWIEKDLHIKIKKKMDPKLIFNPGKLYSFL